MDELPEKIRIVLEKDAKRIPTLPAAAAQTIALASDPNVSLAKLSKGIESDPALAAEILRIANSSFYHTIAGTGVSNIQKALTLLGTNEVRRICLSVGVVSAFPVRSAGPSLDRKLFWEHAASCGVAARRLSELARIPTDGEEFSAGILHDVGKLVLDLFFHEEYSQAIQISCDRGCSMRDAELEVFEVDHAVISGWLCAYWHLPARLTEAVRHHHQPEQAKEAPILPALIQIADLFARVTGNGFGGETTPVAVTDTPAWQILSAHAPSELDLEYLLFQLEEDMNRSKTLLTKGHV